MNKPNPLAELLGASSPMVPPLFQSSVYALPDLDALDGVLTDGQSGFIYARDAHPNARLLAQEITRIQAGAWSVICGSGMAAISALALTCVEKGGRIVASHRLYGRTVQLFGQQLAKLGVACDFVDCHDLAAVEKSLRQGAQMLFVETISNPLLRVVRLRALLEISARYQCKVAVDNTFASPALLKPLALGADLVMESLTKIMGGHSDVTLGSVSGSDLETLPKMNAVVSIWGFASNPFDCWLAQRGLETLTLRLNAACDNAMSLAQWLKRQPGVRAVHYPGLPEHPDHDVAKNLFGERFGHMLCFELEGGRAAVNGFMRRAPGIPFSPSLGHTSTTLSHPWTTSHRYVSAEEKIEQGITEGLVRLSVGCEGLAQIRAEFERGLSLSPP